MEGVNFLGRGRKGECYCRLVGGGGGEMALVVYGFGGDGELFVKEILM